MKRKNFTITALTVLFGLTLVSCNSNEVDNSKLVVGMEANYQPFNWTTNKESEHTFPIYGTNEYADGYDCDVIHFLSNKLGKEVVLKRIEWGSLINDLKNGQINMILAGMTDTEERRQEIDFTDPYLNSDLAFLIKTENMPTTFGTKDNPATYTQLLDLFDGKSLVCQASVVCDDIIEECFTKNTENKNIRHDSPLATYPLAANDVKSGNAFAMPAELPVVEAMTNLGGLSVLYVDYYTFLPEDYTGLSVSIGIKKGNTELKDELNNALKELSNDQRNTLMGEAAKRSGENA